MNPNDLTPREAKVVGRWLGIWALGVLLVGLYDIARAIR